MELLKSKSDFTGKMLDLNTNHDYQKQQNCIHVNLDKKGILWNLKIIIENVA